MKIKQTVFELDGDGKELLAIVVPIDNLETMFMAIVDIIRNNPSAKLKPDQLPPIDPDSNFFIRWRGNITDVLDDGSDCDLTRS